jgi:pyruvate,water dikinase
MEHFSNYDLGGKAKGLFFLKQHGFNVPPFFVISWKEFNAEIPQPKSKFLNKQLNDEKGLLKLSENLTERIIKTDFSKEFIDRITRKCEAFFGENFIVSVRSSANTEDSDNASFAGQYDTVLYVTKHKLEPSIKQCLASGWNYNSLKYTQVRGGKIAYPRMSVIIQKMITPVCSGVMFTRNPNGNLNSLVITSGYGAGEGIVSGKVETDTYYVDRLNGNISQVIVVKNSKLSYDAKTSNKLVENEVAELDKSLPTLGHSEVKYLAEKGAKAENLWGKPLDFEFAIDETGKIHFLQARPITTIEFERLKILDNTNISESYPGLTLPLSISFARNNYYQVFKGTAAAIGVKLSNSPEMENVLGNLIGNTAGRVYYRLDNWYRMMSLIIPGKKGIRNWENSVGLRNGSVKLSKVSVLNRINSFVKLTKLLLLHKKWSHNFFVSFNQIYLQLTEFNLDKKSASEIFRFQNEISQRLYSNWYPTLVNDLIAFKSFGILKSIIHSLGFSENENIANDLLCGIDGVESEKPLLELLNLVDMVTANSELYSLFKSQSPQAIFRTISEEPNNPFFAPFNNYLKVYGDRTTAELKLETDSLRSNPAFLIEMIKTRLDSGSSSVAIKKNQHEIRTCAEEAVEKKFSKISIKKIYFKYILSLARDTIRNRENMRFCRTRAYGAVKEQFKEIGVKMHQYGVIENPNDIFYLSLEQVELYCNENIKENLFEYVRNQKEKYTEFENITPSDRIIYTSDNAPIEKNNFNANPNNINELQGVGVSKGIVKAIALVVEVPNPSLDVRGKIVVTKITDPGWIFIMSQAAGLVSEKGSLLSHTAIVGRELGIPTIVGVENATSIISSGDTIYIDGALGFVQIVEKKKVAK